jgi:two-component system, cell cycle sensor histidine kinase and response regulator CckA
MSTTRTARRPSKRVATARRSASPVGRPRADNQFFREVFAASPDGILLIDARTQQVIDCNEAACRQLGFTRDEFVGLQIQDFEAVETPEEISARVQQTVDSGVAEFEATQRTKTGELRDVHVWTKSLTLRGRAVFYTIFRDVTESTRTTERLRLHSAALNAAADAIVITDRAGTIEWVNHAFTDLTGYSGDEVLGRNPRDLLKSGQHSELFYRELWETILSGRSWHGDMINRRRDGRLYTEEQTITPILDESGTITQFIAIKKDISDRRNLEARFLQAQKMESVGQLASGVAHDFNNLLTVINGTTDLLLHDLASDDPVHADLQEIKRAGDRAAQLTRQLLAFSRQQILEPHVVDLNAIVNGMSSMLERLVGEDVVVEYAAAPDLCHVCVDPGQIEQVITNLAVNARDAMPDGGRLSVETRNVQVDDEYAARHGAAVPAGTYAELAVSDTGTGIPPEVRARIFEPFFTTKAVGKGTGLGLSTVYGIVKQSRGFIWVYGEPGQGTTFKIYFPCVIGPVDLVMPSPAVASHRGQGTILLVEDNAALRQLATRFLEPAGYRVVAVGDAEEALQRLESRAELIDLLLTDVVIPGMNGRLLAERLAPTQPGMKVLYMSGYTGDSIVRRGVLTAQMAFISKPFTASTLLRKVREVLEAAEES